MHCLNLLGTLSVLSVAIASESLNPARYEKYPAEPTELLTAQEDVNKASYFFTRHLFQKLVEMNFTELAISPLGMYLTLSMVLQGVEGHSQNVLRWLLSQRNKHLSEIGLQSLVDDFHKYPGLRVANGFFASPKAWLDPRFSHNIEKTYRLAIQEVDFLEGNEINNAISEEHTNHRMNYNLNIENADNDRLFSLTNTVSFNGTWMNKFNISKTQNRTFYSSNGTEKQLPTMSISGHFRYGDFPEATIVELPFENKLDHAHNVSMFIVLPKERDLVNFKNNAHRILSRNLFDDGILEEIHIQLPRFQVAGGNDLKELLKRMDLGDLFDPSKADFNGAIVIPSTGVHISELKQENVVHVTEEGVSAVSARGCDKEKSESVPAPTTAPLLTTVEEPVNNLPRLFIADHTFYAVIAAASTNKFSMNLFTVQFDG